MKKFILILAMAFLSLAAFGEALSLQNIFPQNYQSLSQLKEDDANQILSGCSNLVSQSLSSAKFNSDFKYRTVFSQNISGRHFYRILITSVDFEKLDFPTLESGTYSDNDFHWLQSKEHAVLQLIVEKGTSGYFFIASDVTGLWKKDNNGTSIYFSDFLILPKDSYTGLAHLKAEVPVSIGQTWDGLTRVTFLNRGASLYGKQSIDFSIDENGNKSEIKIVASDFLADSDSPIKYSLLSALDKNQKTCYKENSAENFISMQFTFEMDRSWIKNHGKLRVTQASIINGDTSSRNNYFACDRIGTITAEAWENDKSPSTKETTSFTLKDYALEEQGIFLPFTEGKSFYIFNTSEIIKATKHDLSLSSFNIKLANVGWIF